MSSVLLEPVFPSHSDAVVTGDNLRDFWKLFTKVKDSMQGGRRLENLCWRLWFRYATPENSQTAQEKISSFFEKIEWRNQPTFADMKKIKKDIDEKEETTKQNEQKKQQLTSTNTTSNLTTNTTSANSTTTTVTTTTTSAAVPVPKNQPQRTTSSTKIISSSQQPFRAPTKVTGFFVPSNSSAISTKTVNSTPRNVSASSVASTASNFSTASSNSNTIPTNNNQFSHNSIFPPNNPSELSRTNMIPNPNQQKKKSKFFIMSSSESSESSPDEYDSKPQADNFDSFNGFARPTSKNLDPTPSSSSSIKANTSEASLFGKVTPSTVLVEKHPPKSALSSQIKGQRTNYNPFANRIWERNRLEELTRNDLMEVSESLILGLQLDKLPLHHKHEMGPDIAESFEEEVVAW